MNLQALQALVSWDRLHESLTKYAESILKNKTASDKEKREGLKVEISGARTDNEKKCKLNFAIHYHWEKISRLFSKCSVFSKSNNIWKVSGKPETRQTLNR